ncbi:MAG: sulfotransferase [Saprospiraceae bacterium]|nr:sulfotransferase [Saprospiraceae bacterium]MCF8249731.1 sulfotransferase [Saprospiraceae bacterium]MCF8279216.1 sulfotransferase [Bacteroidales bacterium]MCF8312764.1 sulfotransferase [Saprospiraceae bacterium]MCF8441211.1 sulfotransferase [Saprospiraceae bacterium]
MKNNLQYQPFIILGTARTGSTMLWSYLNSHPNILCLRGVYGSTNKINFGKFYGELPEEYHSSELIKLRNERPIEFLENYVWKEYSKPFKAVGFKYFYDHDRHLSNKEEVISYFKTNRAVKFLHLKRDNLLATMFSYKRALAQQQWTKANTDFRTSITVQECNDYFQQILKIQNQFDELFSDRTLKVSYDNLLKATERTLQEVLDFIGVKAISLTTETNKNRETKLSDCITNYTELKTHFKSTDYAKYFNE